MEASHWLACLAWEGGVVAELQQQVVMLCYLPCCWQVTQALKPVVRACAGGAPLHLYREQQGLQGPAPLLALLQQVVQLVALALAMVLVQVVVGVQQVEA